MFLSNLRTEFYDVISGSRVLLLVGCDVDALCACKILQYLFQCDNVLYTLIPVYGKVSLNEAFNLHKDQAKFVVLINCGATIDIVETFEPREEIIFFICDSNRPVNILNVYSESQVRLLMKPEDCENIPTYDEIFKDDDSEDEEDEDGRLTEASILKRRERRLWEENREKILFDYYQLSYFGESSAQIMFDLAWKMSRDNNDLLWWSIIGFSEQYVLKKCEEEKYVLNAAAMQGHVSRHNRSENGMSNSTSCMKITFDKDLNLALYRHWSLYESLMYSKYTACKFKLWSLKGTKRMSEFLAEIGLPLAQCRQKFSSMDMEYRNNVGKWMEDMSEKYKLDQIVYGSFVSQFGFKGKFSATDIVYAIIALLESVDKEKTPTDAFLDALDALHRGEVNAIKKGIELAKLRMVAIFKQVQTFIDMKYIINAGPFLYAVVPDSTQDMQYFSHPGCLLMLAHFVLEAHVTISRNRRADTMPLILFAVDASEPHQCLVVAIPPLAEGTPKNFFGKAFEQAAKQCRITISQDVFCSSYIYINKNDQRNIYFCDEGFFELLRDKESA
ncbi:LOW QUALITY PROTEIN: cell division control protein 45 homolog [Uloborus diversus]|uniref:LOW QUALITY PROTEIN: cell division control protein 45 homolog n=1 Tax=Uloborus diversus TaxID=327109 RepID=UPI0024094B17|nr:LOW QUALITY PROTEIN: cell division control protein 45 homolog [Uloborus diversus]